MWNKYARTAARTHGAEGRLLRPSGPTIDIHAHAVAPKAAEFVRPHLPAPHSAAHPTASSTRAAYIWGPSTGTH